MQSFLFLSILLLISENVYSSSPPIPQGFTKAIGQLFHNTKISSSSLLPSSINLPPPSTINDRDIQHIIKPILNDEHFYGITPVDRLTENTVVNKHFIKSTDSADDGRTTDDGFIVKRRLWPIMHPTMNGIADSVASGAHIVQTIFNDKLVDEEMDSAATVYRPKRIVKHIYLNPMKKHIYKSNKKLTNKSRNSFFKNKTRPSPATQLIKPINPYEDMGVTSYKHFEDTVLRELEQREERKAEATMSSFLSATSSFGGEHNKFSQLGNDYWNPIAFDSSRKGIPFATWPPSPPTPPTTAKPYIISKLNTNISKVLTNIDIKPVYENIDESWIPKISYDHPLQEATNIRNTILPKNNTKLNNLPTNSDRIHYKKKPFSADTTPSTTTTTTTTTAAAATATLNSYDDLNASTDTPNYPIYFLKQQQHRDVKQNDNRLNKNFKSVSNYRNLLSLPTTTLAPPEITTIKKLNINLKRPKFNYDMMESSNHHSITINKTTSAIVSQTPPPTSSTPIIAVDSVQQYRTKIKRKNNHSSVVQRTTEKSLVNNNNYRGLTKFNSDI